MTKMVHRHWKKLKHDLTDNDFLDDRLVFNICAVKAVMCKDNFNTDMSNVLAVTIKVALSRRSKRIRN